MSAPNYKKSALVWIISGSFLLFYSTLGLFGIQVPGVEQILGVLNKSSGFYFYLVAFLAAFIEGLYLVGHLIPGSTLMILTAVLSISFGWKVFLFTFLLLWIGWNLAGIFNVVIARKLNITTVQDGSKATDKLYMTWYPAFRANHEVAEVISGVSVFSALKSSFRVKTIVCVAMMLYSYLISLVLDVNKISNEEGFTLVVIFALISIGVGLHEWRKSPLRKVQEM